MFYIDVILKVPYQWLSNKLQHSGYQLDTKHLTTEIRLFNYRSMEYILQRFCIYIC